MTRITRLLLVACGAALAAASARAQAPDRVRVAELSPAAEAAIDRGLRHLAERQNKDGSWGREHHVAVTALSLMAFMVKGHFPEKEPHGELLARAVNYLLREARRGGGYAGNSMYEHGLATLALSEIWGHTARGDEVRDALKKAVAVILQSQSDRGGWRYQPDGRDADISVTVMQIVALASAKEAGILVPNETIDRAIRYVRSCQNSNGGFGYRGPGDPGFARTAAGVASLLICGERNSDAVKRGLDYLVKLPDTKFNPGQQWFHYGQYYAVLAMYQAGEGPYQAWYPRIRDALVASQGKDGGWSNRGEYCTPMSILILGVPYRFLPIYQR
jgi:hypothetical protein